MSCCMICEHISNNASTVLSIVIDASCCFEHHYRCGITCTAVHCERQYQLLPAVQLMLVHTDWKIDLVCVLAAECCHIYRRWPPHHLVDHCYTRCCHHITAAAARQHNPSLPESDCHPLRPAQPVRPGHCYCRCGPCFTRHATATRSGGPETLRA